MKKVLALLMILTLCAGIFPAQAIAGGMETIPAAPFFEDLSVTPSIPHIYSGGNPVLDTGVLTALLRWKNNARLNDVESFMNSTTAAGEARKIEEYNTRPRNGMYGIEDATGWAFTTGADNYNRMAIRVPILGLLDRNNILNTMQAFLNSKFTGEAPHIYPEDVFGAVNTALNKIEINGSKPQELSFETESESKNKLIDLMNSSIERMHEDGDPTLTETEKKQLTDIVTGAMGTGYAPQAGASEGDVLSVSLFGLVQNDKGEWVETEYTEPISFEVLFENDGKTFSSGCSHDWVWYNTDDISHYQYCTKCEAVKDGSEGAHTWNVVVNTAATCTADANITKTCSVCGRVNTSHKPDPETDAENLLAHHVWKEEWDGNAAAHWKTCTVCGVETEHQDHGSYTNVQVTTPRTCTQNASATATCGICGATGLYLLGVDLQAINNPDYLASGHDFTGPLKYDRKTCTAEGQGNHAPTCKNCGERDIQNATAHTWTGLHTVSNGTCGDPNDPVIQEASCECGATLHIEKPREHVPVLDTSKDVQATCTESGKINGHRCTICGTFYDYEFVEALGHDFVKDDEQKADCEKEGYIHYTCSRCGEEKKEIIEKKSANGQHKWVKNVGLAPTCLTDGTYDGEVCEICGAQRKAQGDYGKLDALGHQVQADTTSHGRTRKKVSVSGTPIELTTYLTIYSCKRCGASLGSEYWTVATATASVEGGARYEIASGRNAEITDLKNGIHVDGNMANDGGVHFNGSVLDALDQVIEQGKSKYQYKKVKANSFIIEFTDEFLSEIADGTYPVEIINGSEYWPMLVTVKDHKLVSLSDMEIPVAQELTEAEFKKLIADFEAQGIHGKSLYVAPLDESVDHPLGDVDLNGKVEAADARLALRAAVGLEEYDARSAQFKLADADKSKKIEAGDARLILRAAVGLENLG